MSELQLDSNAFALFHTLLGNKNEINLEQFLASAPMGIAIMSQLMICASRITDIRIDQRPGSLMRHPESFRTTLVQIGNDAYTVFMKAHSNMEQIQIQMAQVPGYVQECVKILQSGNKNAIDKILPRRLKRIQETADDGEKLSKEVANDFNQLIELINQVLEAASASTGLKHQQFKAEAMVEMEDGKSRLKDMKLKEQVTIEYVRNDNNFFILANHVIRFFSLLVAPIISLATHILLTTSNSLTTEANETLGDIKPEKECALNEIKNIHKQMDIKKDITREAIITTLKEGVGYLTKLKTNWSGMASFFQIVKSNAKDVTEKLKTFESDNQAIQVDTSLMEILTSAILKAQVKYLVTQEIAELYVKVSNRYVIGNVAAIHEVAALEDDKIDEAQRRLRNSCQEASNGIKTIVGKENSELIQSIAHFNDEMANF